MAEKDLPAVAANRIENESTKLPTACASPHINGPILHHVGINSDSPTLMAAFSGSLSNNVDRICLILAQVQ